MKEFIFSLGTVERKLIWPFLCTMIQIIQTTINIYYPEDKKNSIIYNFSSAIGEILIIIIPYIFESKNPKQKDEKKCTKQNILHYFLLLLFNGIYFGVIAYNSSANGTHSNIHQSSDYTKEVIEIIFVTILTFLILKYKYFIHHIISLILFCILSIGIDILLNSVEKNYHGKKIIQIILDILTILLEILNYCYQKYMMEQLYYNYWNIAFALGLFLFIGDSGGLIINLISGDTSFFNECKEKGIGFMILYLIIEIIVGFFIHLFRILTLNFLTPNHTLIAYDLIKIFIILNGENEKKWYSIILFIFQFISLAFFLEIFEFNFCNLNKNTKRNINKRAVEEGLLKDSDTFSDETSGDFIEFNGGYVIKKENEINKGDEMDLLSKSSSINNSDISEQNENIEDKYL